MLFLEASDDVLVRRLESVRRPHPLQGDGRLLDGIAREREMLRDLRGDADLVIDTSQPQRARAAPPRSPRRSATRRAPELRATVMSFGFKYGMPVDADMVVDMRFLPNPHWVPELRPLTGLDAGCRDYVLDQPGAAEFLDRYAACSDRRRRLPPRGQAVRHPRGRLHRRQAPQRRHGRGARRAGCASAGVETDVVHRDLGRE